jgi:hypothetical protein
MNAKERKEHPVYTGVLKYFPKAIMEVAKVSLAGNKQHHPDKPLHWDRSKSTDELDALARHLIDAGTVDTDGQRHSAKIAWRALANLEKELESDKTTKSIQYTEKDEQRMDVIGQNGNDGVHYGYDEQFGDYKIQPGDAGTEGAYIVKTKKGQ